MSKPWLLKDMTLGEFQKSKTRYETAVLPFGSVEPHNYHLPYGTDTYVAEIFAERCCEKAWAAGARPLMLPSMPYGTLPNMMAFPLTVNVRPSTHIAFLRDILHSLDHQGIRKLVVFNSHGSNDIKSMMRELYFETKVKMFTLNCWNVLPDLAYEMFAEPGNHAARNETSLCLAMIPDLVKMEFASDGATKKSRFDALDKKYVTSLFPRTLFSESSGNGEPRDASGELGEIYIDKSSDVIAEFLVQLCKSDVDDTFPF